MTWDGSASRFTDEQYRRACVLDRGGDGPVKDRFGLPVREPDGTLNCDGVAAARQRIGQVTGASAEQIAAARSKLEKLAAQCSSESRSRPEPGQVEERSLGELTVDGKRLRGVIPYGVESRDLGGWHEVISPGALQAADLSDLVATVDHVGLPIGRYPRTLELEDRDDGCHWSVDLPESRADVREAVERGDLNQSSFRMVVKTDRWVGQTRHVDEIRRLKDVAVVTTGAYPVTAASAELRSQPEPIPADLPVLPEPEETPVEPDEQAVEPETTPAGGGLTVESRSVPDDANIETRIIDAMRSVPKGESRSLTHATASEIAPPELNTFLWDRLRDSSVVLQSGVRVITTTRKSVQWPRLIADMVPDFYAELDDIDPSDLDFDDFELTPVKIAALARGSSEVFDDSDPSLMTIVNSNLATVLSLKADAAFLTGDTAVTPKGIDGLLKIAGQTINVGGALTSWDPFLQAVGSLAEQHVPGPYVIVTHPRVVTVLALLKEFTSGQANTGLPRPASLPAPYVTSQIGLAAGTPPTTSAVVYAPSMVTVLRRMDSEIIVDRSAEFTSDAVLVRGRVRLTIGSPHTNAIVKLTGIEAPAIGGVQVTGTMAPLSAEPQTTRTAKK